MALINNKLSAFQPESYVLDLNTINLKQSKKVFTGGYSFNFVDALSGVRSAHMQNYDTFFLTQPLNLEDYIDYRNTSISYNKLFSYLKIGEEYINFTAINDDAFIANDDYTSALKYGYYSFDATQTNSYLIEFVNNTYCTISYFKEETGETFVLAESGSNIWFVQSQFLSGWNYQFPYTIDNNYYQLFLYANRGGENYIIEKQGGALVASTNINSVSSDYILTRFFTIDDVNIIDYMGKTGVSYITYNNNFNINDGKSAFNLKNNYLFFKNAYTTNSLVSLVALKNQVSRLGAHIAGNSLLSAVDADDNLTVEKQRDYTSVFNYQTNELGLNYVFYNYDILIKPGTNLFTTPSTLSPYTELDINNTTFANCGAASFTIPYFADKVFQLDDNVPSTQTVHYLCTWLSGAPDSNNKIWMDRYYYPDRVSKYEALNATLPCAVYANENDYIEQYIAATTGLAEALKAEPFFDKASILKIQPNKRYIYDRISVEPTIETVNYCELFDKNVINYFTKINETSKFTLAFRFTTNEDEFTIQTLTNEFGNQFTLTKEFNVLTITFSLFDDSLNELQTITRQYTLSKYNQESIVLSFNGFTGNFYIILGEDVEEKIKVGTLKYANKQIFSGDFYLTYNTTSTNIIDYMQLPTYGFCKNVYLVNTSYTRNTLLAIKRSILTETIDDIYITVPCGQRNEIDTIEIYNNLSLNTKAKSNYINIDVQNIDVDTELQTELTALINSVKKDVLPAGTVVNNITYNDYK